MLPEISWPVKHRERFSEVLRQGINLLGVEELVVALEKAGNGRPVDLHLRVADAHGAVAYHAVALGALVGYLDALDTRGRHGIQINHHLEPGAGGTCGSGQKHGPGGAGRNYEDSTPQSGSQIFRSPGREGLDVSPRNSCLDRLAHRGRPLL